MKNYLITRGVLRWGAGSNRFYGGKPEIATGKSELAIARKVLGTISVVSPHETSTLAWAHGPQMDAFPEGHSGEVDAVIVAQIRDHS